MTKKERLTEIISELMDIYPHLDGVVLQGSVDNPSKIILMSQEEIYEMAENMDFEVEELGEELPELPYLGDDDDDDEGGGILQ